MPRKIEMIGTKFYRLKVVEEVGIDKRGEKLWRCICECGGETIALGYNLRCGNSKSCGCFNIDRIIERSKQHGMSKTRIYKIWVGVRKRCNTPSTKSYKLYGGAGVRMCGRWDDFDNFYEDMKEGYADNLTLDRYPNKKGNYEPGNCRWATPKQQQNNRTNNKIIYLDGISQTLSQWAELSGTGSSCIAWRLKKGWTIKEAIYGRERNSFNDIEKYLIV